MVVVWRLGGLAPLFLTMWISALSQLGGPGDPEEAPICGGHGHSHSVRPTPPRTLGVQPLAVTVRFLLSHADPGDGVLVSVGLTPTVR